MNIPPPALASDPAPSPDASTARTAQLLSLVQREVATVLLIVLLVVSALVSPHFLSGDNIANVADQIPVFGVLAAGQMLAILSAGIDLSIGSVFALGAFCAVAGSFLGIVPAIVLPLVVTGVVGFLNGIGISFTRIPPFIITLAMLSIARGVDQLALATYAGASSSSAGAAAVNASTTVGFQYISEGSILGIPTGALIMIAVFIVLAYVLRYTRFGRHVYAVGGNETAAGLLGVRVRRVKMAVYTISGMLAGLAGILNASRSGAAGSQDGTGYELIAITAVVVGGTLLTGGVGTVRGTIVGLLIVRILPNIFNLAGLPSAWQSVASGGVLLLVVLLQLVAVPAGTIGGIRPRTPPPVDPVAPPPLTPAAPRQA